MVEGAQERHSSSLLEKVTNLPRVIKDRFTRKPLPGFINADDSMMNLEQYARLLVDKGLHPPILQGPHTNPKDLSKIMVNLWDNLLDAYLKAREVDPLKAKQILSLMRQSRLKGENLVKVESSPQHISPDIDASIPTNNTSSPNLEMPKDRERYTMLYEYAKLCQTINLNPNCKGLIKAADNLFSRLKEIGLGEEAIIIEGFHKKAGKIS